MAIFNKIPVIDLAPLFNSENGIYQIAEEVREAYTNVGFAYLINHGVPEDLVNSTFEAAHFFHSLSFEEKNKIKQNKFFRGYMSNRESLFEISTQGKATKPNLSEAFIMAHEVTTDDPDFINETNLAGPNQWPENLPDFKKTVTTYYNTLLNLAQTMVQVFSISFGLEKHDLDQYFIKPTTFLRLQYYPQQSAQSLEDQFGIAPHTDYGFLTLLAQDHVGGLQVKNQAGDWVEAPPLANSFMLNSGDMLKRMTNDVFLSTPHRVINRSGKKRYSIPFFFEPHMHAPIEPLTPFCHVEPAKYPRIEYADHLMARIRGNYNIGA